VSVSVVSEVNDIDAESTAGPRVACLSATAGF
jgi:hypothetical protein